MFRRRSKAKSDESVAYGTASAKVKARRAVLGPKGILKYVDADESLHTVYGSERNLDDSVGSFKSQSNKPQQNAHRRSHSVLFTAIEIREYARTVGDNPSCSSGPPISIGWEYSGPIKIPIDDYEGCRPARRTGSEMALPRDVRDSMLRKEWEVSRAEIASAIRESIRTKHQRRVTVQNLGKDRVEEMLERTGRKVMRGLLFKSSTTANLQKLQEQYEAADAARKKLLLQRQMEGDNNYNASSPLEETPEGEYVSDDDDKEETKSTSHSPAAMLVQRAVTVLVGSSSNSSPTTTIAEDLDEPQDQQCKGEHTAESDALVGGGKRSASSSPKPRESTTASSDNETTPPVNAATSALAAVVSPEVVSDDGDEADDTAAPQPMISDGKGDWNSSHTPATLEV